MIKLDFALSKSCCLEKKSKYTILWKRILIFFFWQIWLQTKSAVCLPWETMRLPLKACWEALKLSLTQNGNLVWRDLLMGPHHWRWRYYCLAWQIRILVLNPSADYHLFPSTEIEISWKFREIKSWKITLTNVSGLISPSGANIDWTMNLWRFFSCGSYSKGCKLTEIKKSKKIIHFIRQNARKTSRSSLKD